MMSNISPLNADEIGHTSSADSEAQALLAELRVNFEALKKSAAEMTAEGAKRAGQVAHAGSEQLRTEIQRAPLIALGIAALFGVIIALAISQPQANRSSYRQVLDRAKRNLPDFDLSGLRDNLYGSVEAARAKTSGLLPLVEQLAQSLSQMEPSAVTPFVEKGRAWAKTLWELASNGGNSLKS